MVFSHFSDQQHIEPSIIKKANSTSISLRLSPVRDADESGPALSDGDGPILSGDVNPAPSEAVTFFDHV